MTLEETWKYLESLPPAHEIPITWDATGYTSEAFSREVEQDSFTGWDGEIEDEEEAAVMARLLGIRRGETLLDVACGYGRHALILAQKYGLQVTGVDISPALIAKANKDARKMGVSATFLAAHGRDLRWNQAFDCAIIGNNSFSVFGPEDAPAVLRGIHAALKKGGRLFLDLDNKPNHVRYGTCYRNWYVSAESLALQDVYFHYDTSIEVLRDVIIQRDFQSVHEFVCFKRLYARDELEPLLANAGFRVETICGHWNLAPFDESSPKIILAAVKHGG